MEHTEDGIRVAHSRHGLGAFALRSFASGDFIGPILGEIMADPDYGSSYAMELDGRALEPAAPFRFLNHSCRPNCALVTYDEKYEDGTLCDPSLWLEIISEIAPGEQMTIDYAWPVADAIPCQCGTANCRGWIVAEEKLGELLSARQSSLAAD
jgi:SET domain-containing protein